MARSSLGLALVTVLLGLSLPPLALHIESKWLCREPRSSPDLDVEVDSVGEADFVVVLGYALKRDGEPTEVLQHRVKAGVRLWQRLWRSRAAPIRLVFSGGHPGGGERGNKSEASSMKDYALRLLTHDDEAKLREIATDNWVLETLSTSTRENALFSIEKIRAMAAAEKGCGDDGDGDGDEEHAGRRRRRQGKAQRVAIVTSKFHQFRSEKTFQKAWQDILEDGSEDKNNACRLEFIVPRVPEGEAASTSPYPIAYYSRSMTRRTINIFREVAAIAYYRARGWIELELSLL